MAKQEQEKALDHKLTETDINFLHLFSISQLAKLPEAPGNRYADNLAAAEFGQKLFFDQRLSSNGAVSCATCHQPELYFSDGRLRGQGLGQTERNTPSLLGAAYGPWKYWDGRKDSLWAQALEPLEQHNEHNITRQQLAELVREHYWVQYSAIFLNQNTDAPRASNSSVLVKATEQSTAVFVNVGKALMAYQRRLTLPPAKFDRFIDALAEGSEPPIDARLNASELAGLRLFMGKASCASCHNGPLFTNFEFHNIGAPEADTSKVDLGRYDAIEQLRNDEFNCLSRWSDASHTECEEIRYLKTQGPELVGAFKTPSLRNVAATAPYMQAGQMATLADVIEHYNAPKPPFYDRQQHPSRPHFDVLPLGLSEEEKQQLQSFLGTLSSPLDQTDRWWRAP
ncbi:MAG: cytochrome-c peroxidase [Pseudomonadales bacterium]